MKSWFWAAAVVFVVGLGGAVNSLRLDQPWWWAVLWLAGGVAFGAVLLQGGLDTRGRRWWREHVAVPLIALFISGSLVWSILALLFFDVKGEQVKVLTASGAVISFGFLIGVAELVGRYRDEPWRALKTSPALLYTGLNGLVSLGTFALVRRHPDWVALDHSGLIAMGIASGFGAMAVLRSKLLTVTLGEGREYSVGPALVVEVLLKTLDRAVDRARATERLSLILNEFDRLELNRLIDASSLDALTRFFETHVAGFQGLEEDEKVKLKAVVSDYVDKQWPARLTVAAISYAWLNLGGEQYLSDVLKALAAELREPPPRAAQGP